MEPRLSYTDGFPYAAPASLDELHGPTSGQVRVPAHVDPHPYHLFSLEVESSRREMYQAVMRAGTVQDQRELLDAGLVRELWPSVHLPPRAYALWAPLFVD